MFGYHLFNLCPFAKIIATSCANRTYTYKQIEEKKNITIACEYYRTLKPSAARVKTRIVFVIIERRRKKGARRRVRRRVER